MAVRFSWVCFMWIWFCKMLLSFYLAPVVPPGEYAVAVWKVWLVSLIWYTHLMPVVTLGCYGYVQNEHFYKVRLIRTDSSLLSWSVLWCKGWGPSLFIRTDTDSLFFVNTPWWSSIASLCQTEGNPIAPLIFSVMMIRTDATAYSSLFTLLLRFLDEEKLVSGLVLVTFSFFLIWILWCSSSAWSGSAGHLAAFLVLFPGSSAPPLDQPLVIF
jgi:hypothetical protein